MPVYGLVILTALLILLFSLLLPDYLSDAPEPALDHCGKDIIAILSLAAMIPMACGRIDLTIGYGIVLWHILAISSRQCTAFHGRLRCWWFLLSAR